MAQDEQTQLLREMRDLLRIIAEPAIAHRDKRLRASLLEVVGKSKAKAKAILLMDGSRNQKAICRESGIDDGYLSRLVKALRTASLISDDEKTLKLVISIPSNFFENSETQNG